MFDLAVQNFTGANSKGAWFDNRYSWMEQATGKVYATNCKSLVVFDNSANTSGGATGSYDRTVMDFYLNNDAAGPGVTFQNGAFLEDGRLGIYGNFSAGGTAAYPVLTLTGSNAADGYSLLADSVLNIGVELSGTTATVPSTISFGSSGNNVIRRCTGILDFGAHNAFAAAVNATNSLQFEGPINGDSTLRRTQGGTNPFNAGTGLANNGNIATVNDVITVSPTSNLTGMIMPEWGSALGTPTRVTVINRSSTYSMAMAASGTSNVASGTQCVIGPGTSLTFWWDEFASLWMPQGPGDTASVVQVSGDTTGATDVAAINALLNTSLGQVTLRPGSYYVDAPIQAGAGATLRGSGAGATTIYFASGFSGTDMITFNGDLVTLAGFTIAGQSSTYSSNPAANGFTIAHRNSVTARDVSMDYVNGWACRVVSDGTSDSYNTTLDNIHSFSCANGCQLNGTASSDHQQNTQLIGCNFDQCQSGDALQIIDVHDAQAWGLKGACAAGTGICLDILGASAGIFISDIDLGPNPSFAEPCIQISSSGGNSPSNITINGGIAEGCEPNILIGGASSNIVIDGLMILNAGTNGVSVASTASQISIVNCFFITSGQTAGTFYDLVWSSSGKGIIRGNWFTTAQGSGGSGQVTAAINPSAGTVIVDGNYFDGAPAFNANFPTQATRNNGYNPVGHVTSPSLGGTGNPVTNPFGSDAFVTVTGGTVTAIAIGGVSTGLTSGSFLVPWNQAITLTYTGTPVWTWFLS